MEAVQNVGANVWCNSDDIRFKTCSVGAIVLGEKFVGLSKGQGQWKRGSITLCDTRGEHVTAILLSKFEISISNQIDAFVNASWLKTKFGSNILNQFWNEDSVVNA